VSIAAQKKRIRRVNVVVFVAPGAITSNSRIAKELETASRLWKIRFHLKSVTILPRKQNFTFGMNKLSCGNSSAKMKALIEFRPKALHRDIAIYYVGGTFSNGTTVGCTISQFFAGKLGISVIVANKAAPYPIVMAHELGHALFTNENTGYTTDPNPLPDDPAHDRDPHNLMSPYVPNQAKLTKQQLDKAKRSFLIR
jgi:hypothetical protein